MKPNYKDIIKHYEKCLQEHGDNHLGVDWPKLEDVDKRYKVMLECIPMRPRIGQDISLLDLGCGTGHLLEYIRKNNIAGINYTGLDISNKFVEVARKKFTDVSFICGDVLSNDLKLANFDFIVMNGVFTEKREMSFEEMWSYFTEMIKIVFAKSNRGIAFNVMSKNVDWERKDLFHVPFDLLADFLVKNLTRDFVFRNDYGLFEYTTYVFKK